MRHYDHRAVETHKCLFQNVFRAHIHMVRWLVHNQQVVGREHQTRHCQTRALAARQHLDLLVDILATEQKCSQNIAQSGTNIAHRNAIQRVENGDLAVHQILLILSVVAYIDIRTQTYRALARRQFADQHTCQRGLTLAIATDECNLLASLNHEIGSAENVLCAEALAYLLHLGHNLTRARCGRELDVQGREIFLIDLDTLQSFELFDSRLHLIRFGRLVAETLDKLLGLFDHTLLVFVGCHLLFAALTTQYNVLTIRHFVVVDLAE